jgi:hypothetical protein
MSVCCDAGADDAAALRVLLRIDLDERFDANVIA